MSNNALRDSWLAAEDAVLLADCDVDAYRASGPGGQKRNKTSSAVRLRHRPTGLLVIAEESRSQHENKRRAVKRLRMTLALEIRCRRNEGGRALTALRDHVTPAGRLEISARHASFPLVAAAVLDAIDQTSGRISDAAAAIELTTGQLGRWISKHPKVFSAANRIRRGAGLRALVS